MDPSEGEAREGAAAAGERDVTQLPIPLNSRHLSTIHLKRLATAIDMPTSANGDKVRQMIEGRLIAQGREPRNVQVVLGATHDDEFYLEDLEGRFLMVESAAPADEVESSEHDSAGSQTETDALRLELDTVRTENARLQDQLKQVKTRLQELSRTNCQSLAQYDELIPAGG